MTRFLAVAALAFGLFATADDKPPKDPKAETGQAHRHLEKGCPSCADGKEIPKSEAEAIRLVVAGDKYTLTEGSEEIEGTHKLDPTKTPKEIDAVADEGTE